MTQCTEPMYIGSGIWTDIQRRAPWYKQDWKDGFAYGFRQVCFVFAADPSSNFRVDSAETPCADCSGPLHMCSSSPQSLYLPLVSRCSERPVRTCKHAPCVSGSAYCPGCPAMRVLSWSSYVDGILTAVQTLAATGVCGIVQVSCYVQPALAPVVAAPLKACSTSTAEFFVAQAIFGGQPLLINNVSEPITITYGYMYTFARNKQGLGRDNFLPWAGWSCVWAGSMLLFVAALNGCNYITRFTRFSGELFGCLVAILFVQQFVQGVVGEFRQQDVAGEI